MDVRHSAICIDVNRHTPHARQLSLKELRIKLAERLAELAYEAVGSYIHMGSQPGKPHSAFTRYCR